MGAYTVVNDTGGLYGPNDDSWTATNTHNWIGQHTTGGQVSENRTSLRFQLPIPTASAIQSAYLTLMADTNADGYTIRTKIRAEDADTAATPTSRSDMWGRTLTTAGVDWDFASGFTSGTSYDTPSLVSVIQEVIDRPGWTTDNYLQIFIVNDSSDNNAQASIVAIEHATRPEAVLTVTWLSGGYPQIIFM